jgi:cytochrome c2
MKFIEVYFKYSKAVRSVLLEWVNSSTHFFVDIPEQILLNLTDASMAFIGLVKN